MPAASITITFKHLEYALLNGVYKVECKGLNINDKFILSSFSVNMTAQDIGTSSLVFTRIGYFR